MIPNLMSTPTRAMLDPEADGVDVGVDVQTDTEGLYCKSYGHNIMMPFFPINYYRKCMLACIGRFTDVGVSHSQYQQTLAG